MLSIDDCFGHDYDLLEVGRSGIKQSISNYCISLYRVLRKFEDITVLLITSEGMTIYGSL